MHARKVNNEYFGLRNEGAEFVVCVLSIHVLLLDTFGKHWNE